MRARLVQIGNSRVIRIPKPLLEQTGLRGEVDEMKEHIRTAIVAPMVQRTKSILAVLQAMFAE